MSGYISLPPDVDISLPSDVGSDPVPRPAAAASLPPWSSTHTLNDDGEGPPDDMNDNDDQIMLPPDPDAWDGGIESAFDDPDDAEDLDQEQIQLALLVDANAEQQVPGPAIAAHLSVHHDMADFYSSPRVLPVARLKASADL